ncbi:MAG TPA: HlyD family efflux transporter periplasmic adaptor subunit [Burkholderiales bacterium]|nr:HlyD family efflux transporter periplasmic adaptor subunit [Burkholderiales bacterium]
MLAAALGAGAWWWTQRAAPASGGAIVLHGNVDIRQVDLAFNASGRVTQMLSREGDRVEPGQLLGTLDTERLRHVEAQAAAAAAAQGEVVARLVAGSLPEEIAKARADAEAARVDAANAARSYQRARELAAKHFVAQQQADDARAAAEGAAARLKSAREALRLVVLGPRQEDIAAAKATLAANQAALAVARRDLAEAELHAPSAGVIESRVLEPGDMASPQKPVYTLALTDPLWVRVYVPETDLGKLRPGSLASVSTDSHPERRYRGWVGYISPSAEFTPKSVETREVRTTLVYQVRVFVCAPADGLRLGMPATVSIEPDQPAPAEGGRAPDPCRSGA